MKFKHDSIKFVIKNIPCFFKKNYISFLFLFTSFTIFFLIFKLGIGSDLSNHIRIFQVYLKHGYFPIPPLYYLTIYLVSLIIPVYPFILSAIFVLTIFSFLKYSIVYKYLNKELPQLDGAFIGALAFSLMFISPIIIPFFNNQFLFVGKFSSTLWHNSTTIFVFPFTIFMFLKSLNFLKNPTIKLFKTLLLISILIILIKPSFLFSFIPVFPIICFAKFNWSKWFFLSAILSIVILLFLIIEQRLIYFNNPIDKLWNHGEKSQIIIAPFKVWLVFAKHPFINIISSFLFVLAFIVLKFKSLKANREIQYALSLLIISLVIFFTFAESGPRFIDGNFYWQIPTALLIVHMLMIKEIFKSSKVGASSILVFEKGLMKQRLLLLIYSLQFISGIYYCFRLIISKNFY